MNAMGLEQFHKPGISGYTVLGLRIGDDEYVAHFQKRASAGSHTHPPEPAEACTLEEVADISSRLFIAATAAAS